MAGRITVIMARTGQAIRGMLRTQAPSRSRLVIGRTIRAVRGITWAAAITPGARDIGHGTTAEESGFTAITLGDKRIQRRVIVGDRRRSRIGVAQAMGRISPQRARRKREAVARQPNP
jgi:hypothetical protein